MRIFSRDISLKKAAVYAAVAAVSLFGKANAQTAGVQDGKSEYKYMKEFAAFVVRLEDEGKTELVKNIKDNIVEYYRHFEQKMEEDQKKSSLKATEGKFSINDLTPKGVELYQALLAAKELKSEVSGRKTPMSRSKNQMDVAMAMLKIKNAEPELHQQIIQQAFGGVRYDEKEGTVSLKGKDGVEYYRHTRGEGQKALPDDVLFKTHRSLAR